MTPDLLVRLMTPEDLGLALDFARGEGWNPSPDDSLPFLAADRSGFFMGFIGDRPVGCVSVVKYGADFAFLGLYIVHPDFRGKGYGKAIWDHGMASASGRTIGLDGVVAQQDNYRRSGFETAYVTTRYGGIAHTGGRSTPAAMVSDGDLETIIAYDATIFPASRPEFLRLWCNGEGNRQAMVVRDGGAVRGYGVIRKCLAGYKIGPLFAENAETAETLLKGLVSHAGGEPVVLDVPDSNTDGVELAKAMGLTPIFETARMYRGPAPDIPLGKVFAVSTLELG